MDVSSNLSEFKDLSQEQIIQRAFDAACTAGFRLGAPAGNQVTFLLDLYNNVFVPAIQPNIEYFATSVKSRLAKMDRESYSGIATQELLVAAASVDVISEILSASGNQGLSLQTLSSSDWLALALAFLMFLKDNRGPEAVKNALLSLI